MQIGGMSSLLTLKTKNKKTLYSNYSFVFFVILSITLITFDIKNIINSSVIRSNIINSIFFTKDFFSFNLPNLDKLKLSFISKEELILENKYLKEKIEQALNHKGPLLCDVKLDPNERIVPKVKAGSSLHNMLPALDDEEIKSNMSN